MAAREEALSASLPDHREAVDLADGSFPRCWRRRCLHTEWQDFVSTVWLNLVRMGGGKGLPYDHRHVLAGFCPSDKEIYDCLPVGASMH